MHSKQCVLQDSIYLATVNDESLEWLKFGESGSQTFWWIKVCQIYHKVFKRLVSHSKLADESLADFINSPNPPNFSHSKL